MGSGMRWDKAQRRDQAAANRRASREAMDAVTRRPAEKAEVVAAWEWEDGLILGVVANPDSPTGKSFARYDRTRKVWTGKMQPWQVERVAAAWEADP